MPSLPQIGRKAPAFTLPAHDGTTVRLSDLQGQSVVLYFYPRDNTPGCTQEACDFRDNMARLTSAGAVVLGVSTDSLTSHQKFVDKFELPFLLLSDPDHAVAEKYGVWVEKQQYGRKYMGLQRSTFLIDPAGKIVEIWPKVTVKGHVDKVLARMAELE